MSRTFRPFELNRTSLQRDKHAANPNLLIDPVLAYSTFLGGPQSAGQGEPVQGAAVIFVDGSGNTYLGGTTNSGNFPVTPGVVVSSNPQPYELGFVSKVDPTGQSLLFSTYIDGIDSVLALAVDSSGNIFVAGNASPPTLGNIAIVKLNSTATSILNATHLGGSGTDALRSMAVDSAGNPYVAGYTSSNDFPTTQNALQTTLGSSGQNGFVTKLNPSLSAVVYSTYLGQTSVADVGVGPHSLAVDSSGNAYVVGTASSGFPTTSGAVQSNCSTATNPFCAFLAKFNAAGSALLYSTYLGPPGGGSQGFAVAVDSANDAYVGGNTPSGFPEVNSVQSCSSSSGFSSGGFLSEIDASGALKFSTCLGAVELAGIVDIAVDGSGNLYAVGNSDATLPLKNPIQSKPAVWIGPGQGSAFVAAISANASSPALLFSSFIGGAQPYEIDLVAGVGWDSGGNIYAAGTAEAGIQGLLTQTPSPFPVFNALQPLPAVGALCLRCSSSNAFLMRISPTDAPAAALSPALLSFPAQEVGSASAPQPITMVDLGSAALTVSNATASGDFSIQNNCGTTSPAGGTCTIQVTFTPSASGTRNGTLTITDNSAGSPRAVELTGQGAIPTLSPVPNTLSFLSQAIGTTSTAQNVALTNPGPLGLQIGHIQTSGDFSETNDCATSLSPVASCTVAVTFTPTASGTRTGTLALTDSATDSPQMISLTGTGSTGFAVAATAASATIAAGATATFSLTATAASGFSGTVNFTCSGAPTASTCSVSPNPMTLTGGTPAKLSVMVATTARSAAQLGTGHGITASSRLVRSAPLLCSFMFGMLLLPPALCARTRKRTMPILVVMALFSAAALGCGGGGGGSGPPRVTGTPSGTYTLTVTGTSGTVTQNTTLNLTVQ